jgi:hypothetical protein
VLTQPPLEELCYGRYVILNNLCCWLSTKLNA